MKYIYPVVRKAGLFTLLCAVLNNTSCFKYVQFKKIKHIPVYCESIPIFWHSHPIKILFRLCEKYGISSFEKKEFLYFSFFCWPYLYTRYEIHEIFELRFFSWISVPQAHKYSIGAVLNFFENSRRYSRINVFRRCKRHRRKAVQRCQRHRRKAVQRCQRHRRKIYRRFLTP